MDKGMFTCHSSEGFVLTMSLIAADLPCCHRTTAGATSGSASSLPLGRNRTKQSSPVTKESFFCYARLAAPLPPPHLQAPSRSYARQRSDTERGTTHLPVNNPPSLITNHTRTPSAPPRIPSPPSPPTGLSTTNSRSLQRVSNPSERIPGPSIPPVRSPPPLKRNTIPQSRPSIRPTHPSDASPTNYRPRNPPPSSNLRTIRAALIILARTVRPLTYPGANISHALLLQQGISNAPHPPSLPLFSPQTTNVMVLASLAPSKIILALEPLTLLPLPRHLLVSAKISLDLARPALTLQLPHAKQKDPVPLLRSTFPPAPKNAQGDLAPRRFDSSIGELADGQTDCKR